MPNDLLLSCPSTDQIFDFVELLNKNYEKTCKDVMALIVILEEHNAVLSRDNDFNSFIKHYLISMKEMKTYDVVIHINSISEISYRNVFIQPNVEFCDNVGSMGVGLPFLSRLLSNYKSYLKFSNN